MVEYSKEMLIQHLRIEPPVPALFFSYMNAGEGLFIVMMYIARTNLF